MSKKVKTFNDKLGPLSDKDQTLLDQHRKIKSGKGTKNEVLTPDAKKLLDVPLDGHKTKVVDRSSPLRIITQEDLDKEKEVEIENRKKYNSEFKRQLKEWMEKDHASEYENLTFYHEDILVTVFTMDVSEISGFETERFEWSKMTNSFVKRSIPADENVFPIVKILSIGQGVNTDLYQVGDVVVVPSNDVRGESWNPDFMTYINMQKSRGMSPVLPEGMKQKIRNVEKNWKQYSFVRPWIGDPEPIDMLTYLLPSPKIRGSFNV